MTTGLEVRLAERPHGWPTENTFEFAEVPVPTPGPGQLVVRNAVMSVDPSMRGRMVDRRSYVPPFQLGKPLEGGAAGEIVASEAPDFAVGEHVVHRLGWREYAVVDADAAIRVDPTEAPLSAYLGVLGMTGMTAYVGLLDIAQFRAGDTVFISGAAGAVGSIAGQLAKRYGAARVIGSAGSAEKVRHLVADLGFDAAFNYKDGPVAEQLAAAAPDGIDVYFDNVGGDHLEAALGVMRDFGRIACCGAISAYNAEQPPPGPRNLFFIVSKRLSLRGFIVIDHPERRADFLRDVGALLRDGSITHRETVRHGLRAAPQALLDMMRGENIGKMLVTL
ncbi:NADP-dependent oxidoreductase [Tamaricihabitans halophyticus]|nr:NADP-dependent oxidoreductase [Tamaricihabitans halophyticus]